LAYPRSSETTSGRQAATFALGSLFRKRFDVAQGRPRNAHAGSFKRRLGGTEAPETLEPA